MKIRIINGPSLNFLGIREPEYYGYKTYEDLCNLCIEHGKKRGVEVEIFQSNHEGDLVDYIQQAYKNDDGIVINPAAYSHTSIAILDALKAVKIPTVEVHISNVDAREPFRQLSYVREACIAAIRGHGLAGYLEAMDILIDQKGK